MALKHFCMVACTVAALCAANAQEEYGEKKFAIKAATEMIFRISEVKVHEGMREAYLSFAREVAEISVRTEPGVVSIFPMEDKSKPGMIRIVEIYRDAEAYAAHIASAHFRRYKSGTLHMVEELRLLDHTALAPGLTGEVFRRAGRNGTESAQCKDNDPKEAKGM